MARGRPMRADARRNRERLLVVAAQAFAEHGEGASLDDIAKRAGVGVGTLYRHFPTRWALLEAAYLERIEAIAARADVIAGELAPGEALIAWLDELAGGMLQVRGLRALLDTAVEAGGPAAGRASCGDCVRGAVTRLVRAAQDAGALRRDVEPIEVLRLVHGVVTAAESTRGEPGGSVRRYLSLVWHGLRA
ncbi:MULTISPECIES: helix-turn-helix domain-containing protein [unclassified Streptomyces]|uniref:TetR/AcrR family transcriptional regulator n=1 Tax=unclassified Streptomyces TaxID=2593676 RepID=UPI0033192FE7